MKKLFSVIALSLFLAKGFSQGAAFNQNSARSNRNSLLSDNWSFDLSGGASFAVDNSEKSLFRGNGFATKIAGRYQFGSIGLGFSGGLVSGKISESAINSFMIERKIDPATATVSTGKPSNAYFLFGPSFRTGGRVQFLAEIQGGMFLNDPGSVSITPAGVQRMVYGFTGGEKNLFPGFAGALQIAYPINRSTRFFINTDYLYSQSSVRVLDLQSGIDIPTEQNRSIQVMTAGLGITKTFGVRETKMTTRDQASGQSTGRRQYSTRDAASGQSTGRRQHESPQSEDGSGLSTGRRILPDQPTTISSPRDAASGLPTGRRYQPGQPVYGNISRQESCGAVTQKIIHPDGTTEENTFACPDDALNYARGMTLDGGMPNRISMNVTVPKQTQGATFGEKVNQGLHAAGSSLAQRGTFGEKVNQGLHAAGSSLSQRAGSTIISGRLTAGSSDNNPAYAIVTNNTTRGGSASLNSQTSSTRTTQNTSFGTMVRNGVATGAGAAAGAATVSVAPGVNGFTTKIYARESSSGMSTGRRERGSGQATGRRERGSGLATGRRQYEPVYFEGSGEICSPCMVNIVSNPLYVDKGLSGNNPMHESKNRTTGNKVDENCDGVAGIDVYLLDPASRAVIAKTITGTCGDYWFANVPAGEYILKVSGSVTVQKRFDVTIDKSSNQDLAGEITSAPDSWTLQINTSTEEQTTKASINTTRSNIKRIAIIKSDDDGDGSFELLRAFGTFADGTTEALAVSSVGKVSIGGGGGGAAAASYARTGKQGANLIGINLSENFTVIATFSDGSSRDITADTKVSHHPNVIQFVIDTEDSDGDGLADAVTDQKVKTKSNIKNDRMMAGGKDDSGETGYMVDDQKIKTKSNIKNDRMASPGNENEEEIWSPRSNLKSLPMIVADLDEDGRAESVVGGMLPGGAVISARVAGTPIGGIIVKGGKNPGGALRTTQTNEFGEFEFTDLEPGNHTITTEQFIIIDDETFISSGDESSSQQRAQDHNSSRSNKTASINNGGGGDAQQKAQDHNSSRSNKSGIIDNGDSDNPTQRAQNNNTVRSNRTEFKSISIDADLDGDGEYETDISTSHSFSLVTDDKGNASQPQQKAGISTSRSNIRTKSGMQPIGNDLYIVYGTAMINGKEVPVQSVLKTKHDTAKNSVGNIR